MCPHTRLYGMEQDEMVINYRPPPPLPEEEEVEFHTRRLEIVICEDRRLMYQQSQIIKGLGNDLEIWSRLLDRSEREMRMNSEDKVDNAIKSIRTESALHGVSWRRGRPTNKEMKALGMPVPESRKTEPINLSQYMGKQKRQS